MTPGLKDRYRLSVPITVAEQTTSIHAVGRGSSFSGAICATGVGD